MAPSTNPTAKSDGRPAGMNGQEARRTKTRELLIETASRLFSERHPAGVTIDDIIQAAGVGKGTFYNHFADKDVLATEVRRRVMAKTDAGVTALNDGVQDPAVRIARGLCYYARLVYRDPVHAGLLAQNLPLDMSSSTLAMMGVGNDVARGIASGRLRVAARESGAVFVIGAGTSLTYRLLTENSSAIAVLMAQQIVAMTLKGLGVNGEEAEQIAAQCCEEILNAVDVPSGT